MIGKLAIRRLDPDEAASRIEQLADVLLDCVEGGASVSFMLPMARETALDFWRKAADGVARGELMLRLDDGRLISFGAGEVTMSPPPDGGLDPAAPHS